jgi:hypothetical protein
MHIPMRCDIPCTISVSPCSIHRNGYHLHFLLFFLAQYEQGCDIFGTQRHLEYAWISIYSDFVSSKRL